MPEKHNKPAVKKSLSARGGGGGGEDYFTPPPPFISQAYQRY